MFQRFDYCSSHSSIDGDYGDGDGRENDFF